MIRDSLALETTTLNYCCRSCSFMQLATVKSVGYGAGSFGTASRNASDDAKRAMSMLLAMARCPRCGHHDQTIARTNRRARIGAQIGVALIFALFGAVFWAAGMAWAAIVFGVVGAITFVWIRHAMSMRYPTEITDQVTFLDGPQPTSTPVEVDPTRSRPDGGWKWM